jgi:hypothetical protein
MDADGNERRYHEQQDCGRRSTRRGKTRSDCTGALHATTATTPPITKVPSSSGKKASTLPGSRRYSLPTISCR